MWEKASSLVEWWQTAISSLASVVLGSILGYVFSRLGVSRERRSREKDLLRNAARGMRTEVESAQRQAEERHGGGNLPLFQTDVWDAHKGYILQLPAELQNTLHQLYGCLQKANAIVEANLRHGPMSGAYDEPYRIQCARIGKEAERAKIGLEQWLGEAHRIGKQT